MYTNNFEIFIKLIFDNQIFLLSVIVLWYSVYLFIKNIFFNAILDFYNVLIISSIIFYCGLYQIGSIRQERLGIDFTLTYIDLILQKVVEMLGFLIQFSYLIVLNKKNVKSK